jgi:hypothetical protein
MKEVNLFPYETFGFRLEHKDDGKVCWFSCQEHLDKYIQRSQLNSKQIKVDYRDYKDGKPVKHSKKQQKDLPKRPAKVNSRSSSRTGRGKGLGSTGPIRSSGKSKPKSKK